MGKKLIASAGLAAVLLSGSLALATPAWATSTVDVTTPCDSLTDGDAQGCKFTGNINTSASGNESYLNAQNAYNNFVDPTNTNPALHISLTPLEDFIPGQGITFGSGINVTMNSAGNGGTFTLDPGVMLTFFAVKAGNDFILYQYTGQNSFTTDGLQSGRSTTPPGLSHILFFGSVVAVPEPGTWGMMLLGFAAMGVAIRRRRSRSSLPQLA